MSLRRFGVIVTVILALVMGAVSVMPSPADASMLVAMTTTGHSGGHQHKPVSHCGGLAAALPCCVSLPAPDLSASIRQNTSVKLVWRLPSGVLLDARSIAPDPRPPRSVG